MSDCLSLSCDPSLVQVAKPSRLSSIDFSLCIQLDFNPASDTNHIVIFAYNIITMDFVNKLTGNKDDSSSSQAQQQPEKKESGGFMDKINGMAGGGRESEKQEDGLDKGKLSCPHLSFALSNRGS